MQTEFVTTYIVDDVKYDIFGYYDKDTKENVDNCNINHVEFSYIKYNYCDEYECRCWM